MITSRPRRSNPMRNTPTRTTPARPNSTRATSQRSRPPVDSAVSDLLVQCGEALFGDVWQSRLSRELGINSRSTRGWLAGEDQPNAGVWADIDRLLDERARAIAAIKRDVERARGIAL